VYSINASISPQHYPKPEYELDIDFETSPNKVGSLIASIKTILRELKTQLPTDEELQKTKEANQRQYEVHLKENAYWQDEIIHAYYHNKDLHELLHYPDLIKSLGKEDIKKAANAYFNVQSLKQFVLYPDKKIKFSRASVR
jgi:zinc protease